MKQILTFSILLLFIVSCKSSDKIGTKKLNNEIEIDIIKSETEIFFTIKNNSQDTIILHNPKKINIQHFENNEWKNLRILICPCDAPCNAPEEFTEILPENSYSFSWNKEESWCGERTEFKIRKTETAKVPSGHYRINVLWFKDKEKINELYKEFDIKNN